MSDDDYENLFKVLRETRPTMSSKSLVAQIGTKVRLEAAMLTGILNTLLSLYLTRDHLQLQNSTLALDVAERAADEKLGGLEKQSPEFQRFQKRVERLLSLDNTIGVGFKAKEVVLEQERLFEEARILTDVRPVFGRGDSVDPLAAMVCHTLRITTHEESEHKTYFFALDSTDLRNLKSATERALKKEEKTRDLVGKTGLPIIDIEFDR